MKTKIVFGLALLFLLMPIQAQKKRDNIQRDAKGERILEKKLTFFKENLVLNEQESKQFDEAYRSYMQDKLQIKQQYRQDVVSKIRKNGVSNLSEREKENIINTKLSLDKRLFELERDFTLKLTKILPSEKVIHYFILEKQFNKELVKRLQERQKRNNRQPRRFR
jgi:hypothetical protein